MNSYLAWITVHIEYQLLFLGILMLAFLTQVAFLERRGMRRKCLALGLAIIALGLIFFYPLGVMWRMSYYAAIPAPRPPSVVAQMNCSDVFIYDNVGGYIRHTGCTLTLHSEEQ
jgi:hypothetical protein